MILGESHADRPALASGGADQLVLEAGKGAAGAEHDVSILAAGTREKAIICINDGSA